MQTAATTTQITLIDLGPAPDRGPRCEDCRDTGWLDPFDATGGSPQLTWCDECLGAGLDDCPTCDGYGSIPEPLACPCAHDLRAA